MMQPCLPERRIGDAAQVSIARVFFTRLSNDQ